MPEDQELNRLALIESFIEIRLPDPENFLKVMETLTRIGVPSVAQKKLFQSCHILHKRGKYYILHFKSCFLLDGKPANISEEDKARTNTIANLLAEWDLIELVDPEKSKEPVVPMSKIKILSFKEKDEWTLVPKFHVGKRRSSTTEVKEGNSL